MTTFPWLTMKPKVRKRVWIPALIVLLVTALLVYHNETMPPVGGVTGEMARSSFGRLEHKHIAIREELSERLRDHPFICGERSEEAMWKHPSVSSIREDWLDNRLNSSHVAGIDVAICCPNTTIRVYSSPGLPSNGFIGNSRRNDDILFRWGTFTVMGGNALMKGYSLESLDPLRQDTKLQLTSYYSALSTDQT